MQNTALATRECEIIIDNLTTQVETYENLEVRYLDNPFGFDIVLTEEDEPKDIFIWIRDQENIITGGIRICSSQVASQAKQHFLKMSRLAPRLAGQTGQKLLRAVRAELRKTIRKNN